MKITWERITLPAQDRQHVLEFLISCGLPGMESIRCLEYLTTLTTEQRDAWITRLLMTTEQHTSSQGGFHKLATALELWDEMQESQPQI